MREDQQSPEKHEVTMRNSTTTELYEGDMREVCRNLSRQYQLIVTDPPYGRSDLPLWSSLAEIASRSLLPGGFLAVLSGLQFLNEVLARLSDSKHGLCYHWTVCIAFSGAHGRRHGLRLRTSWRPVIVMYKPPFKAPRRVMLDRFNVTAPALATHPMEQRPAAFEPMIKAFSQAADWVLDPFAGSGAVMEACRHLGRNVTGCELDPTAARRIGRRLRVEPARLVC